MLSLSTSQLVPATSQILSVSPQVSTVMPVTVVSPQPSLTLSQPILQSLVQPVAQPLIQSIALPVVQPMVQPVVQPVVQSIVQPMAQPVASSMIVTPPPMPQVMPQTTVIPTPAQKTLTPSPDYGKFIPPTPVPQSVVNDMPPKIYQFYQQVPTSSLQAAPTFSTISAPAQSIGFSGVEMPQYRTFSLV